ncbi:hypothetical protein [Aliiroseovarius subalbicans]|uniref:hypothetical protein n=1 Tax=Aliiroseovarius subalbicans TaxID=2925840 RepID=UPI001F5A98D7|nr:hypothetical protein [Aliiroseovarius subalbicans]MCI2400082.1 hypothetical protein [Aliiroseovarius subalbicans]
MAEPKILRIYLDPSSLDHARDGAFGIVSRVTAAFEGQGFRVELRKNSESEMRKSATRNGYSLFLMDDPFHAKALTLRRAYYYPFWRIEASAKRWEFEVAQQRFDPAKIDPIKAENWANRWRKWIFKAKTLDGVTRNGPVYIPLQGRLLERRSFQTHSPVNMIRATQDQVGDKPILLGLHPGEAYSPEELSAVQGIADADPRIMLQTGGMDQALRVCDHIVTENSAAALSGFFFHKPAVLFGQIDFHHQMANVSELGLNRAFSEMKKRTPAFDKYLYWFIQMNAIKADIDSAESAILDRVRRHGWQVD